MFLAFSKTFIAFEKKLNFCGTQAWSLLWFFGHECIRLVSKFKMKKLPCS